MAKALEEGGSHTPVESPDTAQATPPIVVQVGQRLSRTGSISVLVVDRGAHPHEGANVDEHGACTSQATTTGFICRRLEGLAQWLLGWSRCDERILFMHGVQRVQAKHHAGLVVVRAASRDPSTKTTRRSKLPEGSTLNPRLLSEVKYILVPSAPVHATSLLDLGEQAIRLWPRIVS